MVILIEIKSSRKNPANSHMSLACGCMIANVLDVPNLMEHGDLFYAGKQGWGSSR